MFSKKVLKWIFIIVAIIIVVAVLLYIFRCSLFNLGSCVEDPNESNTPVPPGSPTTQWVPESFPLNLSMYGSKIKALQGKFGFTGNDLDGQLGPQTQAAIIATGKAFPLSLSDYNLIMNPPASGGGSNFQDLKNSLAGGSTNFSGGISYPVPGQNKNYRFDFYTNGRFFVNTLNANDQVLKGTYYNGGNKMVIDAGATYSMNVFSNMTNIIKSIEG